MIKRMFSASCLDRFFVSWTAHTGFAAGRETTLMHISEYTIDPATSQATFISDKEFSYCTEPGQIYVSSDCNVVSVLCRSPHEAAEIGAYDFVNQTITDHIVNNVGQTANMWWHYESNNRGVVDQMFLLEWTQGTLGQTSQEPTSKVMVNHAIGGTDMGDFNVVLSKDKTAYVIDMKTIQWDGAIWHEGSVTFSMKRDPTNLATGWEFNRGRMGI